MSIFGIKRKPSSNGRKVREMPPEKQAKWKAKLGQPAREMRRKEIVETFKQRRKAEALKRHEEDLKRKTEWMKSKGEYYKAKAERKVAQKRASFKWPAVPTPEVKIKKKKQGKKLSGKRRIGII